MTASFNASRIEETQNHIIKVIEGVKRTGEFRTLVTDCIEIGIAPTDKEDLLKDWARSRGLSESIAGPPVESDELARLIEKIKSKLSQLPDTLPGIIVIPVTQSTLFFRYPTEIVVDTISREISRFPKLFCVAVTQAFVTGEDNSYATANADFAFVHRNTKGLTEQSIVVFNKLCAVPMSYAFTQQVRRTFIYI
jgi:hypothetical protein